MTDAPPADAREAKRRLTARLKTWGRAGARASRLASLCGVLQYAVFAAFAWSAAGALAAVAAGQAFTGWVLAAAAAAVTRAALTAAEQRFGQEASLQVRAHVRSEAAGALARRGPAFTERADTGETASALVDSVEKLDGYFGRYRPLLPVVAAGPLLLVGAAFFESWVAGAIFLVTAPFLPMFMAVVGAGAAAASRDQLTVLRRLAGRFNDRLQALETLNAFNAAEAQAEGLETASEDFRRRTMKVLSLAFLSSAVLEFFAAIAVAGVAVYVGFALLGELPFDPGETLDLHAGAFVLILAPEVYMPLRRFSAAYHDRADADAAAESLIPFFEGDDEPTPAARPVETAPEIRFEGAGCVYPDGRRGLSDLSLAAEAGKITALWGASGAGKSTALKLLMGYAPLCEGEVRLDGEPMDGALIGQAAWIAQRPRVFHGTLRDNITLFDPSVPDDAVRRAAEIAGVMEFAAALPDGLDTRLGERGLGLSGGQAQRLALARAFVADMPVLLLDEPTAHLDGEAERRFLEALKRVAPGRTVLIATHSPAVRRICDAVFDLDAAGRRAA